MVDLDTDTGNDSGTADGGNSGPDGGQGNGSDSESAGTTPAGEEAGGETSAGGQDEDGGNGLETSQNDIDQNFGTDPAGGGVQSCGPPPPAQVVVDPQKKHWIAIEMVDVEGKPAAGQDFQVTLPDGATVEGSLDGKGKAKITGIDAGNCRITFPKLDQDSWEPQ